MFNARITRLSSLLLALGLLLGFAVTGCSEGNRDQGTDPLVTYKTVNYAFDWTAPETVAKAATIPSTATHVSVKAVDASGEGVLAAVEPDAINDMATDEEGNYLAVTRYAEDAATIVYAFYHEDGEQAVIDCFSEISVANLADGATVNYEETQKLNVSAKVFDANAQETKDFVVGDDIYVQIFVDDDNVSASEDVKLLSSKADVVSVGEATEEAIKCQAKAAGTADLWVEFEGFATPVLATVTVAPIKHITYNFVLDGESGIIPGTAKYLFLRAIDAEGNLVKSGLAETEIAKMPVSEGVYSAETYMSAEAVRVYYVFYHENGEMKVSDCSMGVGVADLEDDATVNAEISQKIAVSLKVMDKEGTETNTFTKGDKIYVQVIAKDEDITSMNFVDLLSDNEKCVEVILGYSSESKAAECEAVGTGEAILAVELDGIYYLNLALIHVE